MVRPTPLFYRWGNVRPEEGADKSSLQSESWESRKRTRASYSKSSVVFIAFTKAVFKRYPLNT